MVLRSSDRISRVPPYLIRASKLPIRGCHPLWPCFPTCSSHLSASAGPRSLAATRGVSIDVLSSGYLDVSIPRVCLITPMYSVYYISLLKCMTITQPELSSSQTSRRWVSPFGNHGIKGCSRLPRAYRRVPRPSSPLTAKTSPGCPFDA